MDSTDLAHKLAKSRMESDHLKQIIEQKNREITLPRELLSASRNTPDREKERDNLSGHIDHAT